ncbi:hypothetical protein F5Y19DRAFT_491285 [Xylariaceae sp. FL1651]|nr:hypothetical protein F5Y19DRAFT_491285 [Xylariaceae sp. FL1651]
MPTTTDKTRNVRLRSACNNCHAAKTKCSGQKTGCDRCADFDVACKYEISMVGKVTGARRHRRRIDSSTDTSTDPSTTTAAAMAPFALTPPPSAAPNTPLIAEPSSALSPTSHSTGIWDMTFDFGDNNEPICQADIDMAMTTNPVGQCASVGTPQPLVDTDFWYGQPESLPGVMTGSEQSSDALMAAILRSSPKHHETVQEMASGNSMQPADATPLGDDGLEYVVRCGGIIRAVEETLNSKSSTLDQVLGACKRHSKDLAAVIDHEAFEYSIACRTLTLTTLNLIIGLLERCVRVEENDHASQSSASSEGRRAFHFRFSLPRVTFGDLRCDDSERLAMGRHLMQAELARTMAVLSALKRRPSNPLCQASTSAISIQETWCKDFQKRLSDLSAILNKTMENLCE